MEKEITGSEWIEKSKNLGEYSPNDNGKTYEQLPKEFSVLGEDGVIYKVTKDE